MQWNSIRPLGRGGAAAAALCLATLIATPAAAQPSLIGSAHTGGGAAFNRIATLAIIENVCGDLPLTDECYEQETVAEIVDVSTDGNTVIHTDSPGERIGFIDISDPENPKGLGTLDVGGEPTSVAVIRNYAVAAINTSESFTNPSGELLVIDIPSRTIVRRIALGGQPDSIAVSRNNRFIAIAIENERNEDACSGGPFNLQEVDEDQCEDNGGRFGVTPQAPAGFLAIIDVIGRGPADWRLRKVSLTGLAKESPMDPEPEYVAINSANIAAVTMQENNYVALVNLASGMVTGGFDCGTVDLTMIDTDEEDVISLDSSLDDVPREPDAIVWLSPYLLATADEGDQYGGSRGFTIFNIFGQVIYTSGNELEHLTVRLGHYPESRSGNKGNEPEGLTYGLYGQERFLFVASERSSVIFVYKLTNSIANPVLHQVLPAGIGPEGLKAIPSRNLLIVGTEEDSREDTFRSRLNIYRLGGTPTYPMLYSANDANRKPIPWGAQSALAADPIDPYKAYSVEDSYYAESSIFEIDLSQTPPVITRSIDMTMDGEKISVDPEGIAVRAGGMGWWVASEGSGSCNAQGCDGVSRKNLIFDVAPTGAVRRVISLPPSVDALQRNNGFEGIAVTGSGSSETLWVAFQREWNLYDPPNWVRIGRYTVSTGEWAFYYYPINRPTSPNGGWIGLSEITALGGGRFAVIERDNQAGIDATFKRIYEFNVSRVTPQSQANLVNDPTADGFPGLTKRLVRDVLPDLAAPNGLVIEKIEGLMKDGMGNTWISTDNDGTDDSSGETIMMNLGPVL